MLSRRTHVQKTKQEKQDYRDYIEAQDYEPTKDESLNFRSTGQSSEELGAPSSKYRPVDIKTQIAEHFQTHWIKWAISVFLVVLSFLMIDSKSTMAALSTKIDHIL